MPFTSSSKWRGVLSSYLASEKWSVELKTSLCAKSKQALAALLKTKDAFRYGSRLMQPHLHFWIVTWRVERVTSLKELSSCRESWSRHFLKRKACLRLAHTTSLSCLVIWTSESAWTTMKPNKSPWASSTSTCLSKMNLLKSKITTCCTRMWFTSPRIDLRTSVRPWWKLCSKKIFRSCCSRWVKERLRLSPHISLIRILVGMTRRPRGAHPRTVTEFCS